MVNGGFNLSSSTNDFGFERGDARVEILDRKGIEILAAEQGDGIVGAAGQDFLRVHAPKVDPKGSAVNKPRWGGTGEQGNLCSHCLTS
jgi:hypothetical protein